MIGGATKIRLCVIVASYSRLILTSSKLMVQRMSFLRWPWTCCPTNVYPSRVFNIALWYCVLLMCERPHSSISNTPSCLSLILCSSSDSPMPTDHAELTTEQVTIYMRSSGSLVQHASQETFWFQKGITIQFKVPFQSIFSNTNVQSICTCI